MSELGNAAQIASAVISLVALATSVWVAFSKKNDQVIASLRSDIGRAFERIDHVEKEVGTVSTELQHVPGKDVVHEMKLAMTRLEGQMNVIIERVGPIKAIAERMQEVMLEHGK